MVPRRNQRRSLNETVAQRYFANENPIGRRFLPAGWKDPITIAGVVGVALLPVAVTLIASYIPAWRATKVDPLQALRRE
jgi:ABC-type lipoprotein release transport system permease subunit